MIAGELFVNLGIKGADKTVGALTAVRRGMQGIGAASLEAKASILAAFYALEKMISGSTALGASLTNLDAILGRGTAESLQRYQWAAKEAVRGADKGMEGLFKSISNAMAELLNTGKAPPWLASVMGATRGSDGFFGTNKDDLIRYQNRPGDFITDRLQPWRQQEKDHGRANIVKKSFGVDDLIDAAMQKGAFSRSQLNKAPVLKEKEIETLNDLGKAFDNFVTDFMRDMNRLNAFIGKFLFLKNIPAPFVEKKPKTKKKKSVGKPISFNTPAPGFSEKFLRDVAVFSKGAAQYAVTPAMKPANRTPHSVQNVNVKQDLHFQHEGKNAHETGNSVKKAINETYRAMAAQGQGA